MRNAYTMQGDFSKAYPLNRTKFLFSAICSKKCSKKLGTIILALQAPLPITLTRFI